LSHTVDKYPFTVSDFSRLCLRHFYTDSVTLRTYAQSHYSFSIAPWWCWNIRRHSRKRFRLLV